MGLFDSLFGGSKRSANDLSDSQYQFKLASKIASLFDGFIIQSSAASFLRPSTAVVLSRDRDVFMSQAERAKLEATRPLAYTKISQLASYPEVRDMMMNDPESAMLTMFMDNLARDTLRHLLAQVRGSSQTGKAPPASGEERPMFDAIEEVGGKLVVAGYRRIAAERGCAPTTKTSDQQIIQLYQRVGTAFRDVAGQRGDTLSAGTMNFIVLKFLQLREMFGEEMLESHLTHELEKYRWDGLRPDYRQEVKLT